MPQNWSCGLLEPLATLCAMNRPQLNRRRLLLTLVPLAGMLAIGGCGRLLYRFTSPVPNVVVPNPAVVPPADPDFVWSQVVDTVDDYFRIRREQPLQASSQVILEGRLETAYSTGASVLEPFRKDSTQGFERWQSTFQSIRRRAIVIVRPQPSGYSILVQVDKELEDVDREQFASETAPSVRHDGSVVRGEDMVADSPTTLGWISLGRDATLEQQILQQIVARITQPDSPSLLHD